MTIVEFEFCTAGESPDFGAFKPGDVMMLEQSVAERLAQRGAGHIITETKQRGEKNTQPRMSSHQS